MLILTFLGCGQKETYSNASNQARSVAVLALEIVDEVLDHQLSTDAALQRISELPEFEKESSADSIVASHILMLELVILTWGWGQTSARYDEMLEARNAIAIGLGVPER